MLPFDKLTKLLLGQFYSLVSYPFLHFLGKKAYYDGFLHIYI